METKNLPIVYFPQEGDELIFDINASAEHLGVVLKAKKRKRRISM